MPCKINHIYSEKATKPTNREIGWLAGIFDGEGHLGLHKNTKGNSFLRKCSITNTNLGIINECSRILRKLNIFHIIYKNRDNQAIRLGRKQCYTIRIDRTAEIAYFIEILHPHIRSTEKQLSISKTLFYIANIKRKDGRRNNRRKRQIPTQLTLISMEAK